VAWGPIEDAGYLAERPEMREALARRLGAVPIPVAQALAALPEMLASGLPVVAFAATNWGAARSFLPVLATPLFSDLRSNSDVSGSDEAVVERLRRLDPVAAQALLQSVVGEEAGRILRLSACGVDPMRPLSELGMDSLMAVELRLALESRLQLELPLMALAEGTSVASIAARLSNALAPGAQDAELTALAARHEAIGALVDEPVAAASGEVTAPRTAAE
jgi:acyl carrier protein